MLTLADARLGGKPGGFPPSPRGTLGPVLPRGGGRAFRGGWRQRRQRLASSNADLNSSHSLSGVPIRGIVVSAREGCDQLDLVCDRHETPILPSVALAAGREDIG